MTQHMAWLQRLLRRRVLTPLEECLIEELRRHLKGEAALLLAQQVKQMNLAQRPADGRQTCLYAMRRGRPYRDPRLRLATDTRERRLATIRFDVPGAGNFSAAFRLVDGFLFSIEFTPAPLSIRERDDVLVRQVTIHPDSATPAPSIAAALQMIGQGLAAYRYEFTSTVDDLLDADAAERPVPLRAPFRWAIVLMGSGWLAAGLFVSARQPAVQPLVWICLGAGILYYFVWRPRRRRHHIARNSGPRQHVRLAFSDQGLNLDISGIGQFARQWYELMGVTDTEKGLLFYFSDATKNWLPKRVFGSHAERERFLEFIRRHTAAPPPFPIFLMPKDDDGITRFDTLADVRGDLEAIDVENEEYFAWDHTGAPLKLFIGDTGIEFSELPPGDTQPELLPLLQDARTALDLPPETDSDSDLVAFFDRLAAAYEIEHPGGGIGGRSCIQVPASGNPNSYMVRNFERIRTLAGNRIASVTGHDDDCYEITFRSNPEDDYEFQAFVYEEERMLEITARHADLGTLWSRPFERPDFANEDHQWSAFTQLLSKLFERNSRIEVRAGWVSVEVGCFLEGDDRAIWVAGQLSYLNQARQLATMSTKTWHSGPIPSSSSAP